ncbi:unnamed protein product [Paramecium primaurelia]|uniref:Uncharacterized protein n=1 Tax=Paramecium primaurelia TaxID=5886 RepID=A0A8S1PI24_PARPR|nr:unnamed protein product [Paramecium primaurelia]
MLSHQLLSQWRKGPINSVPLEPGHGRGIFCMDIMKDHLVTGSADHGLRCYNLSSMKYEKELYAKRYGHTEWVSSVQHLQNGQIVSAGMDSKICLWDAKGVRCNDLLGHQGSITKLMVDEQSVCISSSYDQTLVIWQLSSMSESRKLFGPHKSAVLDFDWKNSLCVSGDKSGTVVFWDINEGEPVMSKNTHKGAVSKCLLYSDGGNNNLVITAGINDGTLAIHDMRTNKLVNQSQIHKGSINGLAVNLQNFIITGSADATCKIIDIVAGFKPVSMMKAKDAVFSIETIYNMTIAGCGDGNVLFYDNDSGQCLYGFGAMNKGCVRQLKINDNKTKLVAIGDDFSPMVLQYQ